MTSLFVPVLGTIGSVYVAKKLFFSPKKAEAEKNDPQINWVSDVTKMDMRPMDRVFYVKDVEDIADVIRLARESNKKISIMGQAHSMGGHTITENGYLINMKYMNNILSFDKESAVITVEPGIMWCDLIKFLNNFGLSPETLQSYSTFSVGGSLSVNAHGITNDDGVANSVVSFKMIDANNQHIYCDRQENPELFSLVMGGYGVFGIIYEVTLRVVKNCHLKMQYSVLNAETFSEKYLACVDNPEIGIKLGRINIVNFQDIYLYAFPMSRHGIVSDLDKNPNQMSKSSQLMYKWLMPTQSGQRFRYFLEDWFKTPMDWSSECERNKLLYETATPMGNLYNPVIKLDRTHILQEYFVPKSRFSDWMTQLHAFFIGKKFHKITLLNITIRFVKQDNTTLLSYAKCDMFAFVLYYRVERHEDANRELESIHNSLTNFVINLGGTFYLPYRHHYSYDQLLQAYPEFPKFVAAKYSIDPNGLFTNMWFDHYAKFVDRDNNNIQLPYIKYINAARRVVPGKEITEVFNSYNHDRNSYNTIFQSPLLTYKFREFLKNIFYLMPPQELFDFVDKKMRENPKTNDLELFQAVRQYIQSMYMLSKMKLQYRSLRILWDQKQDFVTQMTNIFAKIGVRKINGYASMGDPGRNIKLLQKKFSVSGPIYIVHDRTSVMDIVERGKIFSPGKYVHFDYNTDVKIDIPDESVELVTCLMGLHHFPVKNLAAIIASVRRILKPNGMFIIREHDARPDLIPILNAAHNIFNAVTGETLENEQNETRQFRTCREWIRLMTQNGFTDAGVYDMQANDTTQDFMMCFRRTITAQEKMAMELGKYAVENDKKYIRGLDQTYSTLTEWYLVDVAQAYGKFMEHTPYYSFPYWKNIILFWSLWWRMAGIIRNKCGTRKAYFSEYTLASIVMGSTVTAMFTLMSILSFIPRMIYGSGSNADAKHVGMIIRHREVQELPFIDPRIQIIKTLKSNTNENTSLIRVPRYLEFMDIVVKLAVNGVEFVEICGQRQILIKIVAAENSNAVAILQKNPIFEYHFQYSITETDKNKEIALSVKICDLAIAIQFLLDNHIKIAHIYDY